MKYNRKNNDKPKDGSLIEQRLGKKEASQGGDELQFLELTQTLAEMEAEGELPEDFDLQSACQDREFVELLLEYPIEAAVRIYSAEQRMLAAEQNAKNSVARKMQQRAGLPKMSRAGGTVSAQPDYMSMSSEEFRKLEQQLKQAARAGRNVRI